MEDAHPRNLTWNLLMMVSKRHLLFGWFFSGSMLNSTGIIPLILETPETNSEITEQVEPSETETIMCQTMCFLGRLASWDGQICTWNIEWNILDILYSKNINCLYQLLSFHNILCLASVSAYTTQGFTPLQCQEPPCARDSDILTL